MFRVVILIGMVLTAGCQTEPQTEHDRIFDAHVQSQIDAKKHYANPRSANPRGQSPQVDDH